MPETSIETEAKMVLMIDNAKRLLEQHGYVIHRDKSWRNLLERVRVAEVYRQCAEEDAQRARHWAQTTLHNEIRDLYARCTFLYGKAQEHGATTEELAGGWKVVGANLPIERAQSIQCHCGTHPYIITDHDEKLVTRFICPEHGLVARSRVSYETPSVPVD